MKIQITGRHLEITPTLKEYIEAKLHKIEKYSFNIIEAQVILEVEKYRHHAEITVVLDGMVLQAADVTEEMYSTIDKVVDKLGKQLKKHKEKLTDHRIKQGVRLLGEETPDVAPKLPEIGKEKSFHLKPISQKEAVLQMKALQKDFFVYLDHKNKNISLLYKRKAGDLGLIRLEH
ncbi:MAG: ribosome-associated translation inhibitor RaiA [Nitrospirae bacterium]|nr:ribosome-associated translation inhibitor RaiA [Nitrospirota bacterium]